MENPPEPPKPEREIVVVPTLAGLEGSVMPG